jgi:hypothetical protein
MEYNYRRTSHYSGRKVLDYTAAFTFYLRIVFLFTAICVIVQGTVQMCRSASCLLLYFHIAVFLGVVSKLQYNLVMCQQLCQIYTHYVVYV